MQLTRAAHVHGRDKSGVFGAPGHGGEVGDESAQVLLLYSVVVAAGREGQDGSSSLISAS